MRWFMAAAAAILAAPSALAQPAQVPTPAAPDYRQDSAWLCLPGRADVCATPLPTAELTPAGYGPLTHAAPSAEPPADCFYVYPTVSRDPGLNSDLQPGMTEETGVAFVQFARFSGTCRPFAPLYRSATLGSIPAALTGTDIAPIMNLAYEDVRAAWRDFLAHRNQDRPFVIIGHSQGTIHLTRLLAEEIEGRPEAARMLSAILLGFNVEVPEGQLTGGTFRTTPLCTRAGETGCVITYVSYRAGRTPPADALMGRTARPGMTVGCTNPARLGSQERAMLDSYWFNSPITASGITWSSAGAPPAPFLHTSDLVSAQCVSDGQTGVLAITVNADPEDARTDDIPGDVELAGQPLPGWGLHQADMFLAQGNLIALVRQQAEAFARR